MDQGLFRFHLDKYRTAGDKVSEKASVMAIASGKGGVGKTFFSTNLARFLAAEKKKVLLIDCDVYLSNCYLSLGVTPDKDLFDLVEGDSFLNCVTDVDGVHLISGRSGCENGENEKYVKTILGLIQSLEHSYDFIILDCPAGIDSKILSLMTYCDERIVLMNPNKYSLTDAYSLIKTLRLKFGVMDFSTIINKCSNKNESQEINLRLNGTCLSFLPDVRLKFLGNIPKYEHFHGAREERISSCNKLSNIFRLLNDRNVEGGECYLQNNLKMEFQVSF